MHPGFVSISNLAEWEQEDCQNHVHGNVRNTCVDVSYYSHATILEQVQVL